MAVNQPPAYHKQFGDKMWKTRSVATGDSPPRMAEQRARMRYLSFFSGALGLDLGLEAAGWECLAVNEFDRAACHTIRANRPELRLFDCDIRTLTPESLQSELDIEPGEIEAVVGGPPCQAFSTAGRRRSLCDDRGNVFLHFLDLATSLSPDVIVIENVRGLLSAKSSLPDRQAGLPPGSPGSALALILSRLQDQGYESTFSLYDVANYGVPQRRERLVLIAGKDGFKFPHIPATHGPEAWATFRSATSPPVNGQDCLPLRRKQEFYLPMVPQGGNWRDLPEPMQPNALGGAYFAGGGRVGFFRRLAWDAPSPTLVTSPVMPATLLAHPSETRALSIQEYMRIQTFPDHWVTKGSLAARFRQIGNAVPVQFAKTVGEHVSAVWEGIHVPKSAIAACRYRDTTETEWKAKYKVGEPILLSAG